MVRARLRRGDEQRRVGRALVADAGRPRPGRWCRAPAGSAGRADGRERAGQHLGEQARAAHAHDDHVGEAVGGRGASANVSSRSRSARHLGGHVEPAEPVGHLGGVVLPEVWSRAQIRSSDLPVDEVGHRGRRPQPAAVRAVPWGASYPGAVVPTPAAAATTSAADAPAASTMASITASSWARPGKSDLVGARARGRRRGRAARGRRRRTRPRRSPGRRRSRRGRWSPKYRPTSAGERRGAGDEPGAVEGGLEARRPARWPGRRGARRRRRRAASRAARPAAVASGFPDRVPAWYTGPSGREVVHHVGPPTERADVEAAADHLAEAGEVGRDAEQALRAAPAHPEAGDHLVEDQQRTDPVALGPQPGEEARRPAATRPMLAATGSTMTHATRLVERGHLVVGRDGRLRHGGGGHAGRARDGAVLGRSSARSSRATPLPLSARRASSWPW